MVEDDRWTVCIPDSARIVRKRREDRTEDLRGLPKNEERKSRGCGGRGRRLKEKDDRKEKGKVKWGKRGRKCNLNIDVIRFPDEIPLFFLGSDSGLRKYNLGYIIYIIGTTHSSTVYEKQSSFALQNLHYYNRQQLIN